MQLPDVIEQLIDCIGLQNTFKLVEYYGGTPLYIPKSHTTARVLKTVLDEPTLITLCAHFGGMIIESVPTGLLRERRNAMIREQRQRGVTVHELARANQLTTRHIMTICGSTQPTSTQVNLF